MISIVVCSLLVAWTACVTEIRSNSSNSFHSLGISRIRYNQDKRLIATSSYDQTIGIWADDLSPNRLLDQSRFEVKGVFNGEEILSQVSNFEWGNFNSSSYIIANLMGNYLKVYKIDESSRSLVEVNKLDYTGEIFTRTGWVPIPSSSKLLVSLRNKLLLQDFLTGQVYSSFELGKRINSLCLINSEEVLFSLNGELTLFDMSQNRVKDVQRMRGSGLYIVALDGMNSGRSTEVAVSLPMAVLEIYQYDEISLGRKRYYTKIHGFYESATLAPVHHTPYVISGAANQSIVIFDIVNTPSGPINPTAYIAMYPQTTGDHPYVNSIEYLKGSNSFLAAIHGKDSSGESFFRAERFTFCQDPRCIQCSAAYNLCEKCAIGFFLTSDQPDNGCIDCSLTENLNKLECRKVRRYLMSVVQKNDPEVSTPVVVAEGGARVDLRFTSAVVKLSIENVAPYKSLFTYEKLSILNSKFRFEIQTMRPITDYSWVYFIGHGHIYLALNFTRDVEERELTMNVINPVLIEMATSSDSLILLQETKTVSLSAFAQFDAGTVQTVDTTTKAMAYGTAVAVGGAASFALLSLCCPFGFGAAFYSFFQIVQVALADQIMSTLILINVNYGDLLTRSLENIQLAIGSLQPPIESLFSFTHNYEVRSRGKLTWAKMDPLLLANVPLNCLVYIVVSSHAALLGLLLPVQSAVQEEHDQVGGRLGPHQASQERPLFLLEPDHPRRLSLREARDSAPQDFPDLREELLQPLQLLRFVRHALPVDLRVHADRSLRLQVLLQHRVLRHLRHHFGYRLRREQSAR